MTAKKSDDQKTIDKFNDDDELGMVVDDPAAGTVGTDWIGKGPEPGPLDKAMEVVMGDEPIHEETLDAIKEATLQQELIDGRVSTYGDPVDGHIRIAQVWSGILGIEVQPSTVPLLMMGMKAVRAVSSPDYSDHIDDIEGYSDIYRKIVGDDMIQARSVSEYLAKKAARS